MARYQAGSTVCPMDGCSHVFRTNLDRLMADYNSPLSRHLRADHGAYLCKSCHKPVLLADRGRHNQTHKKMKAARSRINEGKLRSARGDETVKTERCEHPRRVCTHGTLVIECMCAARHDTEVIDTCPESCQYRFPPTLTFKEYDLMDEAGELRSVPVHDTDPLGSNDNEEGPPVVKISDQDSNQLTDHLMSVPENIKLELRGSPPLSKKDCVDALAALYDGEISFSSYSFEIIDEWVDFTMETLVKLRNL